MSQDISGLSFEDALAELERIVKGLEGGQQKLEDAISAYERGRSCYASTASRSSLRRRRACKPSFSGPTARLRLAPSHRGAIQSP